MGKLHRLPVQQQQQQNAGGDVSRTFCQRCCRRIGSLFNFKCIVFLVLSIGLFLSSIFWVLPHHSKPSGFDAKEEIKLAATSQAYFRLEKPVSDIVPHLARLEYDIMEEIAIPTMKVAILSVHGGVANQTDVTFGFLPDPDSSTTPVFSSLLRSTLLDLYLQNTNLTLSSSIFGWPSSFEVLKCPGGITVMPEPPSFLNPSEILFNFTLHNSIDEIRENFIELKRQLMFGLRLRPDENAFLQVTNKIGSTKDPPVIVEASVYSDHGSLSPQRLQQLAQFITGSVPSTNLGLDNSVFGKVKQISLSSFLNRSVYAAPPTLPPAPTPAPGPNEPLWTSPSPSPAVSPSPSPLANSPAHVNPGPHSRSSRNAASPSSHAPTYPPKSSPRSKQSPGLSPSSAESGGSSVGQDTGVLSPQMSSSSSISSSSSSSPPSFSVKALCLFWLSGVAVLHILS